MSIKILQSLQLTAPLPVDTRILLSKASMLTYADTYMPVKYFAICRDDGLLYLYDKNCADPSPETGKFKPIGISLGEAEDGLILMYSTATGKWEPVDLADEKSIIYLSDQGLLIKGYDAAQQGYMLVKDALEGISWIKPLSEEALAKKVKEAEGHAKVAAEQANAAAESALAAKDAKDTAVRINEQTMNWVNGKFWWGTIEEYNALTEITEGTFYFVLTN